MKPASPAASCSSWRNSSRFWWMEAITGPVGRPKPDQRRLRELQACLDGFRHRIGDADRIEMAGVRGIARARDDEDVGPDATHEPDDLVDRRLVWMVTMTAAASHQAAALEERRIGGIAIVDLAAAPAVLGHRRRIAVDGKEGKAVPLQHVADDLPDAAVADDDGVAFIAARWRNGELRVERSCIARPSATAARDDGEQAGSAPS